MTAAHCPECAEIIAYYGMVSETDVEAVNRWHIDHPDGDIPDEERAAMAAHTDEATP